MQTPPHPGAARHGASQALGGSTCAAPRLALLSFSFPLSLAKAILSQQRPVRALSIAPLRCPSGASCRGRAEPRRASLPASENPPGSVLRTGMGSRHAGRGSPCPFPLLPWGSAGLWGPFRRRAGLCFMRNAGTSRKLWGRGDKPGSARPCAPTHSGWAAAQPEERGEGKVRSCKVSPPPLLPVLPLVLSVSLEGYGVAGCCLCAPLGGGGCRSCPTRG